MRGRMVAYRPDLTPHVITHFFAAVRGSVRVRTSLQGSDRVRSRLRSVSFQKIRRRVLSTAAKMEVTTFGFVRGLTYYSAFPAALHHRHLTDNISLMLKTFMEV